MITSIKKLPLYSMGVYTVDSLPRAFKVVKFDSLFNVENIYIVGSPNRGTMSCPCYQGKFGRCKHRSVIFAFEFSNRTNRRWFYEYETQIWYLPISYKL